MATITDGGFAAVTEGVAIVEDDCAADNTGDHDVNDCTLAFDTDHYEIDYVKNTQHVGFDKVNTITAPEGNAYKLSVDVKDGTLAGVTFWFDLFTTWGATGYTSTTTAGWVTHTVYLNAGADYDTFFMRVSMTGAGNIEIKNIKLEPITLTEWTEGTGWAPQATAVVLTEKANKIAGTAANLEQSSCTAKRGKTYHIISTLTVTAGSLTTEFGSTNGRALTSTGIHSEYITAIDNDYIRFKADATFAGTIDDVSISQINYFSVTPTWVHPIKEEYNVFVSPSNDMKKDYYLFSPTPMLQYKTEFNGITEDTYKIIQQQWRDVSGTFASFNFTSFSYQFASLLGKNVTPITYRDLSGNANDLGVTGAIAGTGRRGKEWGVQLDGIDDYLEPDPSGSTGVLDFDFWENFSIAFWAKFNPDQVDLENSSHAILGRVDSGGASRPYYFWIYSSTIDSGKIGFHRYDKTNMPSVLSTSTLNDNRWHHVVGDRSNKTTAGAASGTSNLYMYIDGSLENSEEDTTVSQTTNALSINIGKIYNISLNLKANLDQIIIYSIPLTAASVALLTAGTTTLTNKVAYWDFHDDVSMRGRWYQKPEAKPFSKSWNVNMFFEKEV